MKTVKVLKLGTECPDSATGLEGTLTHWSMDMAGVVNYIFQPRGLNDEGQPLKRLYVGVERLQVSERNFEEVDVPFEILGSQVTDKASGYVGMAVEFVRHISGCFHVVIQPKGKSPKTGASITPSDFDLRGCTGEKIQVLTESARRESQERTPSPTEVSTRKLHEGTSPLQDRRHIG